MSKGPDYDALEANLWKKNADEVLPKLSDGDKYLLKKIASFSKKFDYDENDVKSEIRKSKMFAATFSKEPNRQGFHEKVAAEWLRKTLKCPIEVLPRKGKGALYVTNDGDVREWLKPRAPSKSIDFQWEKNGITIYAMHKYTKVSGGAQDNQFRDVRDTLEKFLKAQDKDILLIGIVDGNYYTNKKMAELRSMTRAHPPLSFACHIEEVPDIMKKL